MRNELQLVEKIEQYLSGELSPAEAADFEHQMHADPSLNQAVSLQRDLMYGLERIATRDQVLRAGRAYNYGRYLRVVLYSAAAVLIAGMAVLLLLRDQHSIAPADNRSAFYSNGSLPALNEQGQGQWATADSVIPAQVFSIDAGRDTVIETRGGILISIASNSFLDGSGKAAAGRVSLCVKEALDPLTILTAGLSTTSGGRLLETGGMFFIDARQEASILKVNPAKGLYVVMPTADVKAGMQLFKGKRLSDGAIDWIDPVPMSNDLIPVDINALDFYPLKYIPLLSGQGYPTSNREFTDSVYYSMAEFFSADWQTLEREASNPPDEKLGNDSSVIFDRADTSSNPVCGINPAKIKTIRSARYQNTLLATREFESRLRLIHSVNVPELLDLYVNNLEKNMYVLDSLAARMSTGEARKQFLQFAALRQGKVPVASSQVEELTAYYSLKAKLLTEAIAKTQQTIRQQVGSQETDMEQTRQKHQQDELERQAGNFREELSLNLERAYTQLGYQVRPRPDLTALSTYTAVVTSSGWHNVDRYVAEATGSRTTMRYADAQTGKQAVIEYKPISVSVEHAGSYSRLLCYLLPDKLSSFMRMNNVNGLHQERLNGFMRYDLLCIGFRNEQRFLLRLKDIHPKAYENLRLEALSTVDFEKKLNDLSEAAALRNEVAYAIVDLQYELVKEQRMKWEQAMEQLRSELFHCGVKQILPPAAANNDVWKSNRGGPGLPLAPRTR